jgi:hypothetical protein
MKRQLEPPGPLVWAVCISILLHSGLLAMHFAASRPPAHAQTLTVHLAQVRRPVASLAAQVEVSPQPEHEAPNEAPQPLAPAGPQPEPEQAPTEQPEAHYVNARNLTERPRFVDDLQLAPFDRARIAALGEFDVEFFISETGAVDRVSIEGPQANDADKQWLAGLFADMQLIPGRLGDVPVRSRWHIRIGP